MVKLAENRYGKSRVRLVRVKRHSGMHDLREWTVQILLQGDFDSCFTDGDNRKILPTDTMKNTVYSLARNSAADCIEDFAKQLVAFLLSGNPQVSAAEAVISESACCLSRVAMVGATVPMSMPRLRTLRAAP